VDAVDGRLSSLLSADGVHPNDDGARVVADRMIELLGR
jgi:lysophospholipase L1-like esterase